MTSESVKMAITAYAGGGVTSATQIRKGVGFSQVSTVATSADSVKLPAISSGKKYTIHNNGANNLAVFPPTGEGQIDSITAGSADTIYPTQLKSYLSIPDSTLSAGGVQFITVDNSIPSKLIRGATSPASSMTLRAENSGNIITVLDNAADTTITLPSVSAGLNFVFVAKAKASTNKKAWRIDAGAGLLNMNRIDPIGNPAVGTTQGTRYCDFIANTYLGGDKVVIECDGTYWNATSFSGATGGITFTGT